MRYVYTAATALALACSAGAAHAQCGCGFGGYPAYGYDGYPGISIGLGGFGLSLGYGGYGYGYPSDYSSYGYGYDYPSYGYGFGYPSYGYYGYRFPRYRDRYYGYAQRYRHMVGYGNYAYGRTLYRPYSHAYGYGGTYGYGYGLGTRRGLIDTSYRMPSYRGFSSGFGRSVHGAMSVNAGVAGAGMNGTRGHAHK